MHLFCELIARVADDISNVQDALEPKISKVGLSLISVSRLAMHGGLRTTVTVALRLGFTVSLMAPQETLEVHWGKHHRTYVNNLNGQIKDKPLANKALEEVCAYSAAHLWPPAC